MTYSVMAVDPISTLLSDGNGVCEISTGRNTTFGLNEMMMHNIQNHSRCIHLPLAHTDRTIIVSGSVLEHTVCVQGGRDIQGVVL